MTRSRLVHVVDDDDAVRKSVSFLLTVAGFRVRPWSSGADLLNSIDTGEPACILLDVRMPSPDGLAVQRELIRRGITFPVIIFTGQSDLAVVVQALQAGAADFIEKPFEREQLLGVIEGAFGRMQNPAADPQREVAARALALLDDRERVVLEKLALAWENERIAKHLGISSRAVEVCRAMLLAKLDVSSLCAALQMLFAATRNRPS